MSKTVEQQTIGKIKVSTAWHEVNLDTFIKIGEVQAEEKFKDLNLQKRLRIIALISNYSYEQLLKLNSDNLGAILEATSFLDKEPPKVRNRKPFKIGEVEYMYHPNFKKLSAGEMISVEQLIMDGEQFDKNSTPGVLAILFRPTVVKFDERKQEAYTTIEEFDTDTFQQRQDLFLQELKVDKFYHELAFFLSKGKDSGLISRLSTENQSSQKKAKRKLKEKKG